MQKTIENSLEKALTYQEYRNLVATLVDEGKSTGLQQSNDLANYSLLNHKRMKRLDKTIKLSQETIAKTLEIDKNQTWLVLTESWCGDAAQTLPVINKIAETSTHINLKIVLKDDNEELMNHFLTNGGKSIPKLIALDENNNVVNTWGPRPKVAVKMVADYKDLHGALDTDFKKELQIWYNKNKGESIQNDIVLLLN